VHSVGWLAAQERTKISFLSDRGPKVSEQQARVQNSTVRDQEIRAALDQHWAASEANDFETEHCIYHEDAVLDYPQSGERTRGRRNIQGQRASQPSKKTFTVQRIIGGGDLWVTEYIIRYDGKPSYTVSIMEFRGDKVARETQYFADPFPAQAWRAQWVERADT
jgi:ketosteroid isomerase-like protein